MDDRDKLVADGLFGLWVAYAAHWLYVHCDLLVAWLTPRVLRAVHWLLERRRRAKVLAVGVFARSSTVVGLELIVTRAPPPPLLGQFVNTSQQAAHGDQWQDVPGWHSALASTVNRCLDPRLMSPPA